MQFHCSCDSKRFNSIPLRFIVIPLFALPLPSISAVFYAIAYPLNACLGYAIAYSGISSQLKRPIPEFRH